MKQIILMATFAAFLFAGCETKKGEEVITPGTPEETTDGHNAQNSLDLLGTYKGILPCADCEGIETEITFNEDETYKMTMKYKGKGDKVFEEIGDYSWKEDGKTLMLEGIDSEPVLYMVTENKLIHLDQNGEKITGPMEKNYELIKSAK